MGSVVDDALPVSGTFEDKGTAADEFGAAGERLALPLNLLDGIEPFDEVSGEIQGLIDRILQGLQDAGLFGRLAKAVRTPHIQYLEFEFSMGLKFHKTAKALKKYLSYDAQIYHVPGALNTIGVEIPCKKRKIHLLSVLSSDRFIQSESPLTVALGEVATVEPALADLNKVGNLLITGSSGTGKSMLLQTMLISLLYKDLSDLTRFVLIDPPETELECYRSLPKLALDYIGGNPDKTVSAIRSMLSILNERLQLGIADVNQYNQKADEASKIPYIVVFIDGVEDLLSMRDDGMENALFQLLQSGPQVGIHLVLAARQLPDSFLAKISKTVKYRISFTAESKRASLRYLGCAGAEVLQHSGVMLYMTEYSKRPTRVDTPLLSTEEVLRVVKAAENC